MILRRPTLALWIWSLVAFAFAFVRPPSGVVGATEFRASHADTEPARVDTGLPAGDDLDELGAPPDERSGDMPQRVAIAVVPAATRNRADGVCIPALARGPPSHG